MGINDTRQVVDLVDAIVVGRILHASDDEVLNVVPIGQVVRERRNLEKLLKQGRARPAHEKSGNLSLVGADEIRGNGHGQQSVKKGVRSKATVARCNSGASLTTKRRRHIRRVVVAAVVVVIATLAIWPVFESCCGNRPNKVTSDELGVTENISRSTRTTTSVATPSSSDHEVAQYASTELSSNMQEITIPVFDMVGVARDVQPTDRVDVFLTYGRSGADVNPKMSAGIARILIEDAVVLDVERWNRLSEEPKVTKAVKLEVTPDEAQKLILAGSSSLSLSLRSAVTDGESKYSSTSFEEIIENNNKLKSNTNTVNKSIPEGNKESNKTQYKRRIEDNDLVSRVILGCTGNDIICLLVVAAASACVGPQC